MNTEKPTIGSITVHCKYDELVEIDKLKPHPANPNEHPPLQVQLMKAIISYNGIRRPVRVSLRSGLMTAGHCLVLTLQAMGLTQVPVDYQEYDSEEAEIADLAADNELQRQAVTNTKKLSEIISHVDTGAFNVQLLGMPITRIESIMVNTGQISTVINPHPTGNSVGNISAFDGAKVDMLKAYDFTCLYPTKEQFDFVSSFFKDCKSAIQRGARLYEILKNLQ